MDLSVLKFELIEQVAVITMAHPPVNALGLPFWDDFDRVILNQLEILPLPTVAAINGHALGEDSNWRWRVIFVL